LQLTSKTWKQPQNYLVIKNNLYEPLINSKPSSKGNFHP